MMMNRRATIGLLSFWVLASSVLLVGCGQSTPPNRIPPQGGQQGGPAQGSGQMPTPPQGNQQDQSQPQVPQQQTSQQSQQQTNQQGGSDTEQLPSAE